MNIVILVSSYVFLLDSLDFCLLLPPSIWLYAETLKTAVMFWMLVDIISHSILPIKKSKGEIVSVYGELTIFNW